MNIIADILMAAGAFGAAIYCYVLARRLKNFSTLESGMGGAIAVLSGQVDDMTKALDKARSTAGNSASNLEQLTLRSEAVSAKLELLLAAMHDLPEPAPGPMPEVDAAETADRKLRFVRRRTGRDNLEAAE